MRVVIAPSQGQEPDTTGVYVFRTVDVEVPDDDLNLETALESIIKPALIAWGFPAYIVEHIIIEDDPTYETEPTLEFVRNVMGCACGGNCGCERD